VVVGAFAWEMVTRASRLDEVVRERTDALESTNRQLTTLLDQLHSFHRLSYEINQKLQLSEITRTFAGRLYRNFGAVNGVWIWLNGARMSPAEPDAEEQDEESPRLTLAAQCGRDFGLPPELRTLEPGHELAARCFEGHSVCVPAGLRKRAAHLGWDWLASSPMESFVALPLRVSDTLVGVLGVFSKRSAADEFIRQLTLSVNQFAMALEKARLVHHLQRRAHQLARANMELRQLDSMKDWFISSVSHELRTPLTSIRSFSEILQDYEDLSPEERVEFAGIIREESQRLGEMIDELLNLAKLAHGQADGAPASFRLGPLVERACRLFQQQADERNVELVQDVPEDLPPVLADEMGLARVLRNLVSNAFKFTPEGGRVDVSVRAAEDDGVVVSVSDTGVGIRPEDQERIFERFTQVRNQLTDKTPGTGIGLAICKELVERWGGDIWVESTPGQGSTFSFRVPHGATEPAQTGQEPARKATAEGSETGEPGIFAQPAEDPQQADHTRKTSTGFFVQAVRHRMGLDASPEQPEPETPPDDPTPEQNARHGVS
jgi:signal transduction histidine kinase